VTRRRDGFTLIEALFVCAIASVVFAGALVLLVASQAWTKQGSDQALGVSELRVALESMARDVRESRMVLYPAAGKAAQPALGLITARGEAVFWRLAGADLVREIVKDRTQEVVARRIAKLAVAVADPGGGREPALVRILLSRAPEPPAPPDAGLTFFTSASSRAVLTRCMALREGEP
jgi:type II secretory pathway pseudopilin PulG